MPSLSHKRYHTKPVIYRALVAAGQFAHVQPATIENRLDELYDPNLRFARNRGVFSHHDADAAVPWSLLCAAEWLTAKVYSAGTINYIGQCEGVTCCLCLAIDVDRTNLTADPVPLGMISHICPTFLRHEEPRSPFNGQPMSQSGAPLCSKCKRRISLRLYRDFKWKTPDRAAIWNAALVPLLTDASFAKRVRLNAGNIELLRFDPRRVPQPHRKAA